MSEVEGEYECEGGGGEKEGGDEDEDVGEDGSEDEGEDEGGGEYGGGGEDEIGEYEDVRLDSLLYLHCK